MDIERYIRNRKKVIDRALDKYLPSSKEKPKILHKVMRYAVFPGGKRIRPILTLASFEACGGRGNSIIPVACAIELIHAYTLIHDDLPCMDDDDYRRGKLTCHKKFGEGIALLAGDALLTLGFQLLSEAGNADVVKEVSTSVGSRGTVGGQAADVLSAKRKAQSAKRDFDYIASRKTGALFEAAVKAAGLLKRVGRKKIRRLSNFGRYFGFTFQLIDDLIDRDGYVEIYGAGYVNKMARLLTEKAKSYLDIFGKRADRLLSIADFNLLYGNSKFPSGWQCFRHPKG